MAQKIYDIIPPKAETKNSLTGGKKIEKNSGVLPIKVLKEPKAVFTSNIPQDSKINDSELEIIKEAENKSLSSEYKNILADTKEKPKMSFKKWAFIAGGFLLIFILGYFYFSFQKAKIEIWPKTELLSSNDEITADKSISEIDFENKKIPAEIFEIEKELWQDFPATGDTQNSAKASGTIKIYNKLNPPSAFTLKTGTHFLSDSGKYFVTSEKITIPAGTLKSGKITPGSVSIKVVAEDAGKDYNIEASKFSIPKLVGTDYYYSIYAESTDSMTGGFLSDVKKVTDLDLSNAKKELSEKVLSEVEISLRQKIPSDYVVFGDAILKEVAETFSPVKSGAVVDNFSYQAKVKAKALAFKRQDIEKFAKNSINSQSPEKSILEKSFKLDFNPESVDMDSGKIVLASDTSCRVYQPIEIDDLNQLLAQKNKLEVKDIIFSRLPNQVERLDVTFWPFWTQKVPTNKDKINIELKFE